MSEREVFASSRRTDPPPRMGPLSGAELRNLARRYLNIAEAGLSGDRPHQATGALFALAGILEQLGEHQAAVLARSAVDGRPAQVLVRLRTRVGALLGPRPVA